MGPFPGPAQGCATGTLLIGSLMLAASCSPAVAQDHETWRCTTPNGHYDNKLIPVPAKATTISGRIAFHSGDFGGDWNSIAQVSFRQDGSPDGNCHCSGIAAYGFQNPNHVEYDVKTRDEDSLLRASYFDTAITFRIEVDPKGLMTVTFGKNNPSVKTVPISYTGHDSVELSCSGADVSFLNIDVQ
jgi:hypothetical protein